MSTFPLFAGLGAIAIAWKLSEPAIYYDTWRENPIKEWRMGWGNDHMHLAYYEKLQPFIEMTGDPQRYLQYYDLHNSFRRNYNVDHTDGPTDEAVWHESRWGSGIIGEPIIRNTSTYPMIGK